MGQHEDYEDETFTPEQGEDYVPTPEDWGEYEEYLDTYEDRGLDAMYEAQNEYFDG